MDPLLVKFHTYLWEAEISFLNDPADSNYQRGYEAAVKEISKEFRDIFDWHCDNA